MAIFRSPVMVLLGQATPQPKLPIAASGLTLVQHLVGALRFTAYSAILSLGPLSTFAIGSGILAGAGIALQWLTPKTTPQHSSQQGLPFMPPRGAIAIVGTGISLGLASRFLFASVSQFFALHLGENSVAASLLGFSFLLAFSALPAGQIASRIGNAKATILGLISTALGLALFLVTPGSLFMFVVLLLGIAFSLALNGMLPFVLETSPSQRSGLGMGLYFGSFSGAIGLFGLGFAQVKDLTSLVGGGILCLVLTSGFVASVALWPRCRG